ncbi:MAG: NADP-dependent succinic semialdehyde dehydrogenase [Bdellovibrionales bacterium RIFOXYC1_FULL_54_43]|nr:MAG: NADP-dependent succinic semialdehyde dehydrogenase [Bdellovibrionales bacterium RIFOXYC1_FULL_54_43]
MPIQSVNPATGEKIRDFGELTRLERPQIEEKLQKASQAFKTYRRSSFDQRRIALKRAAEVLSGERAHWARLMTLEMGKPIQAAEDEVEKCALTCRYYAEHAEKFLESETIPTEADQSYVKFQPLGIILAVMPWNFPFWQVFRFAAPALMAGNVCLLKHASNVPQCALAIEEILRRAGVPDGVFQTLLISGHQADELLDDPRVAAATLTGSDETGAIFGSRAAAKLKKTVLELGGSDPFIVMPSANLERAVEVAVKARTINNGQSCIAAKRFIVAESIADSFEGRFVRAIRELKVGDPLDRHVQIGPLATQEILETIKRQVADSVRMGARLLTGGKRLERSGYFYEPTVLADLHPGMPAYDEEVFGPVALLFRARDLDEALRIGNSTQYGLGASFWSESVAEQDRFIDEIESGLCFVNGMVASDPRLPFGGIKKSGHGRELSHFGIREFVNIKTVSIRRSLKPG